MNKVFKKIITLFTVGFIIGSFAIPVFATVYSSSVGYYGPILGYSYENQSKLYADSNSYARAYCTVANQDNENVEYRYMAVNAWLFKDDTLVEQSGWLYSSGYSDEVMTYTDVSYSSGDYYADGQTRAYNGDGYYTYGVFSTDIATVD